MSASTASGSGLAQGCDLKTNTNRVWSLWAVVAVITCCVAVPGASAQDAAKAGITSGPSGMPTPRYVSLKSDRVNLRSGPGTEYPTTWVFRRVGMPVEVVKEFEAWRQVRDAEGAIGWVLSTMLSGRRTALVLPWEIKPGQPTPEVPIKDAGRESARPVAMVEAGVIANVTSCDKRWCAVVVGDFRGYIEQAKLWGVYPDEAIK